jgi:putative aldouronate transport system substrate-binding protein
MDKMTAEITEKFGIEIEFVVAADNSGSQLATLISSEDYPDIITVEGLWNTDRTNLLKQMAEAELLSSYNDLAAAYLNEEEWKNFRSDIIAWYALSDGKTYSYPNYGYSTDDLQEGKGLVPNRCIVVRADMLAQLGYDTSKLVDVKADEFLDMCERAVNELGAYNGLNVIGMQLYEGGSEAADIISQYFAKPWETKDGKYYDDWTAGTNKETYAFLNEAYRRGLITDANYSDTRDQVREKIASGRVFALIAAPQDFAPQFASLYDSDPNAYYVPIVVRNANGDDPTLTDISGWGYLQTAVSASNKAPEQTIKLISWLLSDEGAIQMNKGWEGEQWQWEEDGTISYLESWKQAANDDPTLTKKYGLNAFDLFANWAYLMHFEPKLNLENPNDLKTYHTTDTYIKDAMSIYSYRPAQYVRDPSDERALPVSEEETKLRSYMTIAEAQLLTASSAEEFEAKYTEIQETRPLMANLDLIVEYQNDCLQAGKNQLGVKYFFPPYAEAAK